MHFFLSFILQVPMDYVDVADKLIRGTRHWNWKKNSTQITIWPEDVALKWRMHYVSQNDKLKFGSKIVAWNWKRKFKQSKSSTNKKNRLKLKRRPHLYTINKFIIHKHIHSTTTTTKTQHKITMKKKTF